MIREKIESLIKKAIKELQKEKIFPEFKIFEVEVKLSERESYGDYTTNVAMRIAKKVKKNPLEIANLLISKLDSQILKLFERIEVVKPGFINFFISKKYLQNEIKNVLKEKESYGQLKIGKKKKVQVEFISANPTGPLTLGNGRGGFCGDVLANVLSKAGYKVEREYYINDRGEQIKKLGHSVIGDSQAAYKGKYIKELRKKIKGKNPESVGKKAAKLILKEIIKPWVKDMEIKFDVWFSENSLYKNKEVDKVLKYLKKKKLTYEKDGALWFQSTKFGDDKDRVLIKENGEKTYLASDIAYLKNKFNRGFKKIYYFWGADHYGYIRRMKAATQALGFKKEQIEIIIMQLVAVMWAGKKQRMAKRKGIYWGIDELIKELGLDVVRFFFLTKSPGSHLVFDLDLAKERSEKNPVYYVQYAYARACSILRKLKGKERGASIKKLSRLIHPNEQKLIKQIIRLPEIIKDTAEDYQVQRIPQYSIDLAVSFHQFYNEKECKVLTEDKDLRKERVALIKAVKITFKNTFELMGISAPEKM